MADLITGEIRTTRESEAASAARPSDLDVLVVGAGPTGLLTAVELLRRGIRVRVIDRATEPMLTPKALSVWPRALDILEDTGLGEVVGEESVRINTLSYFSERRPLASFGFSDDLACRTLPQHVTERLLTERLLELGGKIERGVRLLALDGVDYSGRIESTDGVTAVLETPEGLERVRVPFVVGADGAGSAVRGQLGIGFEGSTYEMAFALVDARIEGYLPPDECHFYQSANGALVIVPIPGGIFRFLSVMPQGNGEVDATMMQSIIDERGPRGVRIEEAVWKAVFRVHARRASEFQRGRVFLAGDAAHVHSPAGGQGMNNGLQDAHNLAWKLAAVIRGESPPRCSPPTAPSGRRSPGRSCATPTCRPGRGWRRPRRRWRPATRRSGCWTGPGSSRSSTPRSWPAAGCRTRRPATVSSPRAGPAAASGGPCPARWRSARFSRGAWHSRTASRGPLRTRTAGTSRSCPTATGSGRRSSGTWWRSGRCCAG